MSNKFEERVKFIEAAAPQAWSDVGENQRHIRGGECYAVGTVVQGGKLFK